MQICRGSFCWKAINGSVDISWVNTWWCIRRSIPLILSRGSLILIKWSTSAKSGSKLSIVIRKRGVWLIGFTIWVILTKIWLKLTIIWLIFLILSAIIWSITLSIELMRVMWREKVYWASFRLLMFGCYFLLELLLLLRLIFEKNN